MGALGDEAAFTVKGSQVHFTSTLPCVLSNKAANLPNSKDTDTVSFFKC